MVKTSSKKHKGHKGIKKQKKKNISNLIFLNSLVTQKL